MDEYINKEEYCENYCRCSKKFCERQSCPIWKAPAADVEPVRHGRWESYTHSCYCGTDEYGEPVYRDGVVYYCSNPKCRRKTVIKENYCPNCGAKMDLEGETYDD